MSSYFDAARQKVDDLHAVVTRCTITAAQSPLTPEQHNSLSQCMEDWMLNQVADLEEEVAHDVQMQTGDREFPNDLREKMLGIIALWGMTTARTSREEYKHQPMQWLLTTGQSRMIEELHDAHHELARRRITTRFGILLDSPSGNNSLRDEWEKEKANDGK